MATQKSIYIWILFGILIIRAWLLGSVTLARAQTYTLKCRTTGYALKANVIEVGDVHGHIVGVGEMAGVQSCDDGSVATTSGKWRTDLAKGNGKSHFYVLVTYEDGSTTCYKGINTVTANPDGKTARWEEEFEYIKGTGRFEGIQGSGSAIGKRLAPVVGAGVQFLEDITITYTLPSK